SAAAVLDLLRPWRGCKRDCSLRSKGHATYIKGGATLLPIWPCKTNRSGMPLCRHHLAPQSHLDTAARCRPLCCASGPPFLKMYFYYSHWLVCEPLCFRTDGVKMGPSPLLEHHRVDYDVVCDPLSLLEW